MENRSNIRLLIQVIENQLNTPKLLLLFLSEKYVKERKKGAFFEIFRKHINLIMRHLYFILDIPYINWGRESKTAPFK